jgi:hypothetical protein
MSSPDLITPDRLESLLAGDPPESVREAVVQGLVRELRAGAPEAPASLRERVLVPRAPAPRRVSQRRLGYVLVFAVFVAAIGAAVVSQSRTSSLEGRAGNQRLTSGGDVKDSSLSGVDSATLNGHTKSASESDAPVFSAAPSPLQSAGDAVRTESSGGLTFYERDSARARDVKMAMELRLPNADDLSQAAQDAMDLTTKLGGVVAASKIDTSGAKGSATLQLQVPVKRLDEALAGLSQLGTITAQNVTARDLQGSVDQTTKRIRHLRAAIASDKLRLESGTLTATQTLDVQLRLIRERQQLDQIRREKAAYLDEAATAEVTLGLHTGKGATVGATHGTFRRTLDSGLTALAKVAAVALLALIVAAPLVLLGLLMWLVARSRRRRIEAEILNRPRPATPSTPPSA